MSSSLLNGSGGRCGLTQVISSVVTGSVAHPCSRAAALSIATTAAKRVEPLENTIAHHGIENEIHVLSQCRAEIVVLFRVHYSSPRQHAGARVEEARLRKRPRRAVDL